MPGRTVPTPRDIPPGTDPELSAPEAAPSSTYSTNSTRPAAELATPPDADAAFDDFDERAAIREHDGGQPHDKAEAGALAEAAQAAGITAEALRRLWADHPDARAYLAYLTQYGPAAMGAAAMALGWNATRAWQAEARLRAAGLVSMDDLGRARPLGSTP